MNGIYLFFFVLVTPVVLLNGMNESGEKEVYPLIYLNVTSTKGLEEFKKNVNQEDDILEIYHLGHVYALKKKVHDAYHRQLCTVYNALDELKKTALKNEVQGVEKELQVLLSKNGQQNFAVQAIGTKNKALLDYMARSAQNDIQLEQKREYAPLLYLKPELFTDNAGSDPRRLYATNQWVHKDYCEKIHFLKLKIYFFQYQVAIGAITSNVLDKYEKKLNQLKSPYGFDIFVYSNVPIIHACNLLEAQELGKKNVENVIWSDRSEQEEERDRARKSEKYTQLQKNMEDGLLFLKYTYPASELNSIQAKHQNRISVIKKIKDKNE